MWGVRKLTEAFLDNNAPLISIKRRGAYKTRMFYKKLASRAY
jgi:hypothetical protein